MAIKMEDKQNNHSSIFSSLNLNFDILLYSGEINVSGADEIVNITEQTTNDAVILMLCTPGGGADEAYRVARRLQLRYKKFVLYVYGYCKSAGTLIAVGSDEIIMGDFAEFGPLDVQVADGEEIGRYSSGLNVFSALAAIKDQSSRFFHDTLKDLIMRGISTKNAIYISTHLTTGFFRPILSKIDPIKIGELDRAIKVAIMYGTELIKNKRGNISAKNLMRLVSGYPDHGYVIDLKQAESIFTKVRQTTEEENKLGLAFKDEIRYPCKEKVNVKRLWPINGDSDDAIKQ